MENLLSGYRRFRHTVWPSRRERFQALAQRGQKPETLVIACSDSRVDPAMVFDAGPGEIFIVRNVANLVPPFEDDTAFHGTSAAIEFAVRVLEVREIIVMGHAMCGGIHALLHPASAERLDFMSSWVDIAAEARDRVLACEPVEEKQQQMCEFEAIKLSLRNLMTFRWVESRVTAGRLTLHGASFDIRSGVLSRLNEEGEFVPAE
ncbi:carbonic anhydrase [Acidisoma cellulosilytica]|uniref:Carbonic anhydrase n=1 Tax=Acidisoma cellulosilyticum TaxID=2802395 RepID=A0A964E3Q5_9PROT|nr:carbonic anhydrase [Acidisoma cellulosilyticum]MCB8880636.1 carbonic anhydrase [Acidisoma cellulosilyticum]